MGTEEYKGSGEMMRVGDAGN